MRKHRSWTCPKCFEAQYKMAKSWVDEDIIIRQLVCLNCKAHIFTKEVAMEKSEYFWKQSRPIAKCLKSVD